jgi:hypothetical protein
MPSLRLHMAKVQLRVKMALLEGRGPCVVGRILLTYADSETADERTRTADLISLRVIIHRLQAFAGACKSRISKRLSLLRVAACCTVLRSRWYQSGIKTSASYSLTSGPIARTRALRSHNPPTRVSACCPTLHNRLI